VGDNHHAPPAAQPRPPRRRVGSTPRRTKSARSWPTRRRTSAKRRPPPRLHIKRQKRRPGKRWRRPSRAISHQPPLRQPPHLPPDDEEAFHGADDRSADEDRELKDRLWNALEAIERRRPPLERAPAEDPRVTEAKGLFRSTCRNELGRRVGRPRRAEFLFPPNRCLPSAAPWYCIWFPTGAAAATATALVSNTARAAARAAASRAAVRFALWAARGESSRRWACALAPGDFHYFLLVLAARLSYATDAGSVGGAGI
jgi:hypothetical protein